MRLLIVFGILFSWLLSACTTSVSSFSSDNRKIDSSVPSDAIDTLVVPYRSEMEKRMDEVIGYADSALLSHAPESPLGNFVADVVFQYGFEFAQTQGIVSSKESIFALLNFGGLRRPINQGDITVSEIYELMPFDNSIVIVQLTTDKLKEVMSYLEAAQGQPVSNARFLFENGAQSYSIGKSQLTAESFYVITSDYLAGGGDKMSFFKDNLKTWNTGLLIRDVLIEYIRKHKTIPYSPVEGRVKLGA